MYYIYWVSRRLGKTKENGKNRGLYYLLWKRKRKSSIGNRFFCTTSAVKRVEFFFSDRISYIILSGCWFNIFVLNVHVPSEEKGDDLIL
jgi:hypothetical protein